MSLLQPVVLLGLAAPAGAVDLRGCYVAGDAGGLQAYDPAGDVRYPIGATAAGIEGMALRSDGTLFAVAGGTLGTIDTADGTFAAGPSVGDLRGLAFDADDVLYAVRAVTATDHELVTVDPASGDVTTVIALGLDDVSALAVAGGTGHVFDRDSGKLYDIDLVTGAGKGERVVSVGTGAYTDIAGLSFDGAGTLWASAGERLLEVADGGTSTVVASFAGADLRGIACGSASPNQLAGTVFHDTDRDGGLDAGEPGVADATEVRLVRDGVTVQTTTTTDGAYAFEIGVSGPFTVVVAIPDGAGLTTTSHDVVFATMAASATVDVGYAFSAVGGMVFDDRDGDGSVDDGEPPLDGVDVTVSWTDGDGQERSVPTTSDAAGAWEVDDLPPGDVQVAVDPATAPAGWPATGTTTRELTLDPAEEVTGVDFGFDGSATVTGTVWNDLDGEGDADAGEPPLDGVDVVVVDAGGTELGRATTEPDGTYTVGDLAPGDAVVRVDPASLPAGATPTVGEVPVTLEAATTEPVDLLVQSLATIGGRVHNDLDGDRTDDDGSDPGFAGVRVELFDTDPTADPTSAPVATVATDDTGAFAFTDLLAGDYWVRVHPDEHPGGLAPDPAGPLAVTVATGEVDETLRIGFAGATTVSGTVFADHDDDGLHDPDDGEEPLANVRVLLDGTDAEFLTGADGTYRFTGLAHGDHAVDVDPDTLPPDAAVTPALPATVTTAAGGTETLDLAVDASVGMSGRVVNDLNADGDDESGADPGLAGTLLQLRDDTGDAVGDPVEVDGDGRWAFTDLAPATWTVEVVEGSLPAGAERTYPDDAGAPGSQEASFTVELGPFSTVTGLDVGYAAGGSIEGRLWDDVDGDGEDDGIVDEPGLSGHDITIRHPDGSETTATTGLDGTFGVTALAPGLHEIEVTDETTLTDDGYVGAIERPLEVEVGPAGTGRAELPYWRPATITLTVFDDADGSRTQDPGETGVAGVEVTLHTDPDGDGRAADGDTVGAPATTGPDGTITFGDLPPGSYVVDPVRPDHHIVTTGNDPAPAAVTPGDAVAVAVGVQANAPAVTVAAGEPGAADQAGEAGDELVHAIVVTNAGNVTDAYALTATSDADVTFSRDADGDEPITSVGPLAPGESGTVHATVTVPAGHLRGEVLDTTVVATGGAEVPGGGGAATATLSLTTTVQMPVLGVTITSSAGAAGYVEPGEVVAYTVTVDNLDGEASDTVADARGVEVALDVDRGTIDPSTIRIGGTDAADAVPVELGTVAAGTTITITFEATVDRPLADGSAVTALAVVTATNPEGDPREARDATSDVVSSAPLPDLFVTVAPDDGALVEPGDTLVYEAEIGDRADATDTWRDVRVVADLPDGVTVTSVTAGGTAFAGDPAAGIPVGDLAPDEYVTVRVEARVDDPIADATVITAVLEATGNNGGPVVRALSHTVEARLGADLDPDRSGTGAAGDPVAHAHELVNTGNVTAVFDLTATTDLAWPTRVVQDTNANGAVDDGEPELTETPPIAGGDGIRLLSVVDVPAEEPDGSTATTTIAAFSRVEPPVIAEAFAVTATVAAELDVDVVATPSSTVVERGQVVTYTTTIANQGGATAEGVTVEAPTPSDATYVTGSARLDGAPVADGPGDANPFGAATDLADLAPGATRTIAFDVTVDDVADGTPLVHRATAVTADGRAASDSVTQTVSASPVLHVELTATPPDGGRVTAGTEITYTAVVHNVGTLAATGVVLRAAVPDRTGYVTGSTTLDGAGVSDSGGTTRLASGLSLGSVAPDTSRTVRVRVRVADPVFDGEEITAVVTASSDQGVTAASRTLRHLVDVRPAVSLGGSGSQDVARPGQAVHAHTVRNLGDVTDTFTLQARSDRGWRVSLVRDDDGDGTWDPTREVTPLTATGALAPGTAVRFFAVVEVAADATLGSSDTTTVTARSVVDPNVTATATDRTRATAPSLEVTLSATPSGELVNPGSRVTYVLSVRNRGGAPASDVVVTATTPAGTAYVPDSVTRDGVRVPDGLSADGNPLANANGGVRLPSLAGGGELLVTYAVTVPADTPVGHTIAASASVTATATTPASATKVHTVASGPVLDLTLSADPPPGEAAPAGSRITYTLAVRNTGQGTARDVRVTDDTPRDTTYVAGSTRRDGAPVADGRTDPNPLSSVHGGLSLGDLAPGAAPVVLRFTVAVDDPVPADARVENLARAVSGDVSGTTPTLVHHVAVTPGATVTPNLEANAVPGGFADLAHVVTNTGDVTDAFDLGAESSRGWVTSIVADRDADGVVDEGDPEVRSTPVLAPGEGTTVIVRVAVPDGAETGLDDEVRLSARSSLDPAAGGAAVDTIAVVSSALRLTKTATPLSLAPGVRSTYTLRVSNIGRSTATDVRLVDAPPAGTRYVSGSTRRDGIAVPDVDGRTALAGGLALGTLAPEVVTTVTFEVETLDDDTRTSVVNSAIATAADAATARAGTVQPVSRRFGLDLAGSDEVTVAPGSAVAHSHLLTATGVSDDAVSVAATSSLGLPVALHVDRDGDGELDADDPTVDGPLALAAGERVRLLSVVTYGADVPEGARDDVVVTASSAGDTRVEVAVTAATRVSSANVTVTLTATPAEDVGVGEVVTYDVAVTNHAAAGVDGVLVTVDTPVGTVYEPGSARHDDTVLADAEGDGLDGNPLHTAAGGVRLDLPARTTTGLRFAARVGDEARAGELVAAVAGLTVEGTEPRSSNTVQVVVVDRAGLQVAKAAHPTRVEGPGAVVTWTLTVMNASGTEARAVVLTDPPAAGTRYVAGSTRIDGEPAPDGIATAAGLRLGDLPTGGTRVVTFQTVVDAPGAVVQNVASAEYGAGAARVLSNLVSVGVDGRLPATGTPATRTLKGAAALLAAGWTLLYVARPERAPRPVLTGRRRRTEHP